MTPYREAFVSFALEQGALRFGEFTLKSGRSSPYFFNVGLFNSGASLARLGRFYADAVAASGIAFDMVFGPAYKGIPLATTTAIGLAERHGRDVPFAFDRKEAKAHGESGKVVGAPLQGRVLIVDDVVTAGTAVTESAALIRSAGATPAGVAVALDRQERGSGEPSAMEEVQQRLGAQVVAIVTLQDIIDYLEHQPEHREGVALRTLKAHLAQQGA